MFGDALLFGGIDGACIDGADGDATHAGDAACRIGGFNVLGIDGAGWADFGACAAVYAGDGGLWNIAAARAFFVWAVAWHFGHGVVALREFFGDAFGHGAEGGSVGFVWAASGIFAHDGMLGDGFDGSDDAESASGGEIGELDEFIVVGAVAVDGDEDGARTVAADVRKTFGGKHGHAAAVAWHRDDGKVICGQSDLCVIGKTVGEIANGSGPRAWARISQTALVPPVGLKVMVLMFMENLLSLFCQPGDVVEGVFRDAHAGERSLQEAAAQAERLGGEMEMTNANAEIDHFDQRL